MLAPAQRNVVYERAIHIGAKVGAGTCDKMKISEYWKTHPEHHWYGLRRLDLPYGLGLHDSVNANGDYRMGWYSDLSLCIFLHHFNKFLVESV